MNVETPSADPREVAYYESLAETWWDPTGPFWPLHRLNVLRTDYLRQRLGRGAGDQPLQGVRCLDIGCGGGLLSESMARLGADVHGIDVVAKNIGIARAHAADAEFKPRYDCEAVENLAARGEQYDLVLNMEVVEHVAELDGFMDAACKLVAPGGTMVVATINRNPKSWLFAIVGAEYVLRWLPRGTHRWQQFVRPGEVEAMFRRNGLARRDAAGVTVNPLTRRFRITGDLSVNYMLIADRSPSA